VTAQPAGARRGRQDGEAPPPEVIWHEVECGQYRADLPLWRELAAAAVPRGASASSVLDIGAGIGRVALDLAAAGHRVTALDVSPALLGELARRPGGAAVQTVVGDARDFALEQRGFDLCVVPMQTLQLLRDERERRALFDGVAAHLRAGALLACAIVTADAADPFDGLAGQLAPSPDRMAIGERVYFSRPLSLRVLAETIRIERERVVLPGDGADDQRWRGEGERDVVELARVTAEQLWREAAAAGLRGEPTRLIAETDEHTASEVVMLRA
jgi:SAM-dependent methyltransferase